MNRKRMTFWLLLFLLLSAVASAQQATKADIQALETKVSNLEITVKEMDKRITAQIQAVHVRIDELDKRIAAQIQAVHVRIDEMDKRLATQIQAVNARIDELGKYIGTLINILIGVVLAAIALPQVLGYLQGRRERADIRKQIQNMGQRIERQQQEMFEKLSQQQQEIEALKFLS